jgi:hypothetical protein
MYLIKRERNIGGKTVCKGIFIREHKIHEKKMKSRNRKMMMMIISITWNAVFQLVKQLVHVVSCHASFDK